MKSRRETNKKLATILRVATAFQQLQEDGVSPITLPAVAARAGLSASYTSCLLRRLGIALRGRGRPRDQSAAADIQAAYEKLKQTGQRATVRTVAKLSRRGLEYVRMIGKRLGLVFDSGRGLAFDPDRGFLFGPPKRCSKTVKVLVAYQKLRRQGTPVREHQLVAETGCSKQLVNLIGQRYRLVFRDRAETADKIRNAYQELQQQGQTRITRRQLAEITGASLAYVSFVCRRDGLPLVAAETARTQPTRIELIRAAYKELRAKGPVQAKELAKCAGSGLVYTYYVGRRYGLVFGTEAQIRAEKVRSIHRKLCRRGPVRLSDLARLVGCEVRQAGRICRRLGLALGRKTPKGKQ